MSISLGFTVFCSELVFSHSCYRMSDVGNFFFFKPLFHRFKLRPRKIKQLLGAKNAWQKLIRTQVV